MKIKLPEVKDQKIRDIIEMVVIVVIGILLLNVTFLLNFGIHSLLDLPISFFVTTKISDSVAWVPHFKHWFFVVCILVASWFVFKSRLPDILRAAYLAVPASVVLVAVGFTLNPWPIAIYIVDGILTLGVIIWFYYTKKPWIYYFALIVFAVALFIARITGIRIWG